jgi:hypothetical protein
MIAVDDHASQVGTVLRFTCRRARRQGGGSEQDALGLVGPCTLHGRIGNLPASEVEVIVDEAPPHRIRVRGRVDEAMFKFCDFELWTEVSTVPGSLELTVSDVLKNKASYPKVSAD